MTRSKESMLASFSCLLLLSAGSQADAAIDCADCIYDADGDDFNEADDDLVDICLGESDPTWTATCEAYDFNGNSVVDNPDLATWLDECGSEPIACRGGCSDCIYDADGDGFNEEDDDLIDICLGESDPTWTATCEAYDFDDSGIVDNSDVATWDGDCGSAPIACEEVPATTSSLPATSPTGRVLTVLLMLVMAGALAYAARRQAPA